MGQSDSMYRKDYEALQEMLLYYPAISIVSTEKDPPEQYVIEYKLFGYGYTGNGDIQMARRHQIQVTLPFGYPHFPPTVKPLTKICHPDVAEHAIRIAGFWQENPSLADLIIHIGDMIRGEVYSIEGAFNEQAAEWYQENQDKLPLAELQYNDPNSSSLEISGGGLSIKRILAVLIFAVVAVGAGLFYRDTLILQKSQEQLQLVNNEIDRRQFQKASRVGTDALESLSKIFILGNARDTMQLKFDRVLTSDRLREGLAGRVAFQGEFVPLQVADALHEVKRLTDTGVRQITDGDLETAKRGFATAIKLAEQNNLIEAANEVKQVAATKRFEYHVEQANIRFREKEWHEADSEYGLAISILDEESRYLESNTLKSREKLETLQILAQVNVIKDEAILAEKEEELDAAARSYKTIVSLIRRSDYRDDQVLAKIAADAEQEGLRLAEELLVVAGTAYLLENFKEIFLRYYPGLRESALQSPQVRFMGRIDGKIVFAMSCIELIQRHSNEFQLSYQYDPARRSWTIYREKK